MGWNARVDIPFVNNVLTTREGEFVLTPAGAWEVRREFRIDLQWADASSSENDIYWEASIKTVRGLKYFPHEDDIEAVTQAALAILENENAD